MADGINSRLGTSRDSGRHAAAHRVERGWAGGGGGSASGAGGTRQCLWGREFHMNSILSDMIAPEFDPDVADGLAEPLRTVKKRTGQAIMSRRLPPKKEAKRVPPGCLLSSLRPQRHAASGPRGMPPMVSSAPRGRGGLRS